MIKIKTCVEDTITGEEWIMGCLFEDESEDYQERNTDTIKQYCRYWNNTFANRKEISRFLEGSSPEEIINNIEG